MNQCMVLNVESPRRHCGAGSANAVYDLACVLG